MEYSFVPLILSVINSFFIHRVDYQKYSLFIWLIISPLFRPHSQILTLTSSMSYKLTEHIQRSGAPEAEVTAVRWSTRRKSNKTCEKAPPHGLFIMGDAITVNGGGGGGGLGGGDAAGAFSLGATDYWNRERTDAARLSRLCCSSRSAACSSFMRGRGGGRWCLTLIRLQFVSKTYSFD